MKNLTSTLELADKLIRDTVMTNHDVVVRWMGDATGKPTYDIVLSLSQPIGYGYIKTGDTIIKVNTTNKMSITLKKSIDNKNLFILTAFPDLR